MRHTLTVQLYPLAKSYPGYDLAAKIYPYLYPGYDLYAKPYPGYGLAWGCSLRATPRNLIHKNGIGSPGVEGLVVKGTWVKEEKDRNIYIVMTWVEGS